MDVFFVSEGTDAVMLTDAADKGWRTPLPQTATYLKPGYLSLRWSRGWISGKEPAKSNYLVR